MPVSGEDQTDNDSSTSRVVVTATAIPTSQDKLGVNVTVIDSQTIESDPGRDLAEILTDEITGLEGTVATNTVPPNLQFMGLPGSYQSQRVLFLYDGVPLRDAYVSGFDIRRLSMIDINSIEVGRGLSSHLYGTGALSGVIQLLPDNPPEEGAGGAISAYGENFNGWGVGGTYGVGSMDGGIKAFAQRSYTDGYMDNSDGSDQWVEHTTAGARGYFYLGDYSLRSGILSMRLKNNTEDFYEDVTQDIFYGRLTGTGPLTDLTAWASTEKRDLSWRAFPGKDFFDLQSSGARWTGSHTFESTGGVIVYGTEITSDDVHTTGVSGSVDARDTDYAFTTGYETYWGNDDKQGLSTGFRVDYTDQFGGEFSPRIAYILRPDEKNKVFVAAGRSYRAPQASDLYMPPMSFMGMTFEGNPNLQPETAVGFEIGGSHTISAHQLTWGAHYTMLDDAWDYMLDPDFVFRPHNVTEIHALCAEISWKWQLPGNRITLNTGYTYTDSIYEKDISNPTIEGNNVEEIPPHQGHVSMDAVIMPDSNLRFRAELKWASKRPDNADNSLYTPSYEILDLGVSIGKPDGWGTLSVSVTNALDEEYFVKVGPPISAPPRMVRVSFTRKF